MAKFINENWFDMVIFAGAVALILIVCWPTIRDIRTVDGTFGDDDE
jgi:hypothetical protein